MFGLTYSMNKEQFNDYLYENIPLSKALGIVVDIFSHHQLSLKAPFRNNINHKKTVFGGSLHAVATLSCWSLLYINLTELYPLDIVITESHIQYLMPVTSDFVAQCIFPEKQSWHRFLSILKNKGKGRIKLQAKIYQEEKLAVDYEGTFAAVKRLKP